RSSAARPEKLPPAEASWGAIVQRAGKAIEKTCEEGDLNQTRPLKNQRISRRATPKNPHLAPRIVPSGHNVTDVGRRPTSWRLPRQPRCPMANARGRRWPGEPRSSVVSCRNPGASEHEARRASNTPLARGGGGGWVCPAHFHFSGS